MSSSETGGEDRPVESSVQVVAKSSMWQGLLRTATVLATSTLLEIIGKLLENRVGESSYLASASSWLSRIAILVVCAAAIYVLVRKMVQLRDRVRVQRDMRLTDDLIPPGPEVRPWGPDTAPAKHSTRRVDVNLAARLDPGGHVVAKVLSTLPFERYDAAALYDMVSAVLAAGRRLPLEKLDRSLSAATQIERLTAEKMLVRDEADWIEVRSILPESDAADGPEWDAALPALVHHHADRATRWAAALDTRRLGAGARRWFAQEDSHLYALIRDCGSIDSDTRAAAVPELIRIADALDRWYATNGWSSAKDGLAQFICDFTTAEDHPVEHDVARLRAGRIDSGSPVSRLHRYASSLAARRDQRRALALLESGWTDTDRSAVLEAAADLLERAWRRVPAVDAAGEVCVLVDLSIVRLQQGRLDAARNCLAVAQTLASADRDPEGLAHVYETLGVLRWMRGEPRRALHDWQRALTRYRELDHALGIARCLQHLGSAAALAPEHGGLLLSGQRRRGEVLRQAGGWLAHAGRIRPAPQDAANNGGPVVTLAESEQKKLRSRLESEPGLFDPAVERPSPLEELDEWPLAAPEDGPE
ncbi:tetratricopeptide repeat protein [Nocardia alni]|uniref:tetratricopeptide repeat protein n=1 Tax=Nocardia alni TaxID=2815723 RepID=UPI001C225081|nr:tetratricopeptide repeat protein [Nocardia alni]